MIKQPTNTIAIDASRIADEAIADFLQATEVGKAPDRSDFVREHSGIRSVLESFFEAYDQMEGNARTDDRKVGSFAAGQQLGRHRLVRAIGSGSFGTVWLGFDSQLKRPVAIKVPNQNRFSNQKQRDLFLSEAQNVAQLEHPNIVPIYDVGETEAGEIYLVSRFVAGDNLSTEMQNRRYSHREAANCVAQIASALEYAHGRNLIHRDVKPSNILIDAVSGQPFITDFGLAHVSDDRSESSIAGTPAYMSPEQAAGEPLDYRSDVFSLGIVFFELLCGARPFTGKNARAVMKSIREDSPPAPSHIDPQVPGALQKACLKSLSKPVKDRYDSSVELESDLRAYLDSQSADSDDRPQTEVATAGISWRLRAVAVVGILAFVAGSYLGVTWLSKNFVENSSNASTLQAHPNSIEKSIDRQIAEKTLELGGHIDVKHEGKDYEVDSVAAIPAGDISLLWVMFTDGQTIDDEYLSSLRMLDSLEGINLFGCDFSNSGFTMLGEIKTLRYVFAPATQVNDAAAKSLARLPRLCGLSLKNTNVTDETLRQLEGCKTIRILRVSNTLVTDAGLKYIGTMPNLQELNVSGCRITDAGVKHLSSLGKLRIVKFSQTNITAASLEYLKSSSIIHLAIQFEIPEKAASDFLALHPNCRIICE